jgi:energy-coupling factor transport system substrate-specific component
MNIKDLVTISLLATIIFVLEMALAFLPNVQLTVLFIILYTKTLGFKKTFVIVTIYFILDAIIYGGLLLAYIPFMYIGWMIIPISLSTVFRKIDSSFGLALLSILFALLYSWIFIIPSVFIFNIPFLGYLIADIPFEILLVSSSYFSVLFLYEPLKKLFETLDIN